MTIIYDVDKLEGPLTNPVLTIGNFDGVHKGHQILFDKVKERARAIGGKSAVITFDPHPIKVMKPGNGPPLITSVQQKLDLISEAGMDIIFCFPFTREFAFIPARDFVQDIRVEKIGVKEMVVGYDYAFGHKRKGNIGLLLEMGERLGFKVHEVNPIHLNSTLVSSTSIRNFLQDGDIPEAKKLLGRNYQISGDVVKGKNRGGRLLGFPTANLEPIDELVPKRGVYAVTVDIEAKTYYGVSNIGYNPTFGDNALSVETHILDFSGDLIEKTIKVNFIQRLRDEKTFSGVEELTDNIAKDILQARELFSLLEKEG